MVERKVGEVAPALQNNRDKISKLIETLEKQLSDKGVEINAYMAKHNIQVSNFVLCKLKFKVSALSVVE